MKDALSINDVKSARELLPREIKYSEVSVKKCYDVLENWSAIFDDSHILSLSSGRFAEKKLNLICLVQKIGIKIAKYSGT